VKIRLYEYDENQSVPIFSYSYANSIDRKMFNYKEALQDINIEEYLKNPLTCDCFHSPLQYNPSGHVITGDLNIIQRREERHLTASWSLNIDLGRLLIEFVSL
jgi:hypothetical protein